MARCREKGLDARAVDFLGLSYDPASFDAVYALNCLVRVPNADLPAMLERIRRLLRPGRLFFLSVHRSEGVEGVDANGWHNPPRFFSWRTDERLREFGEAWFDIEDSTPLMSATASASSR